MSKLSEIRMLFDAKLKNGIPDPPGSFDPQDLERVKSDKYLHRLLEHCENNVQVAVEILFDIMVWRKTNSINDINEETINMEYVKEGIFFPHGRDIDSCIIFIMKSKLFVKGKKDINELKRVIIYWFERLEREEDGKKLTIFFDMDGCGLNNMDIEIITYMITLLKHYYPNFVNYIIVFQLPWMLSAGFKLVRSILPARAVEKLRTINKDKLKDLVAPEQALVSWGGKDDYAFEFIPETRTSSNEITTPESNNHSPGEMLSLNPPKILMFKKEKDRVYAQLTVKNMDESAVSFKIRTTAPDKYVVRPSSSILISGASQVVIITVNSIFEIDSIEKDRFLVVSIPIPKANVSQKELAELWKNTGIQSDEYRLKCAIPEPDKTISVKKHEPDPIECKINNLQNNHKVIIKSLNVIKLYQLTTMVLMFLSVVLGYYTYFNAKSENCYTNN